MFFNSVKEMKRLGNEINRLFSKRKKTNRFLIKEMSNIYLKDTIEEKNHRETFSISIFWV